MANPKRGEVEIKLDRPRKLRFDWNALAKLQGYLGSPPDVLFCEVAKAFHAFERDKEAGGMAFLSVVGPLQLRAMLCAALSHEEPSLTPEETTALMEHAPGEGMEEQLGYIFGRVWAAWLHTRGNLKKKLEQMAAEAEARTPGPKNGGTKSEEPLSDSLASLQTSSGD